MEATPESNRESDAQASSPQSSFLERTITSVLALLAQSTLAIFSVLCVPRHFAGRVARSDPSLPPPYSFLILSLLVGGVGVRLGVASFEQPVDHTVVSRLAQSVSSISFEDIFVLTVPGIVLVAVAGMALARATAGRADVRNNAVVNVLCYAAGFQFTLIGVCCIVGLLLKAITGISPLIPGSLFDRAISCGVFSLIVLSMIPVYHVVRIAGTTRFARSRLASAGVSLVATMTVLLGAAIVNAVSFDLATTIAEVRLHHQHRMLSDVYVAARTLSSRMVTDDSGSPAIEMHVALVNVSDTSVLIPRPHELEHAFESEYAPLRILSCSAGRDGQAGWVITPCETRIVRWLLDVPAWCGHEKSQKMPFPIAFECYPFEGTSDLLHTHPIGDRSLVYAELAWPMSEAWKRRDNKEITRISQLIEVGRIKERQRR